ncbi:hypothetical protein [Brevibacillus dissolubilis]|uniref:hypothetical protein n=1 Tax=Brevibacillus dissolubilis TaxID=1844116 RepID=UPI0011177873|nr:hypothetical protein [Brevibacillus dissolubilis]
MTRSFVAGIAASVGLALALSIVPSVTMNGQEKDMPTFQAMPSFDLSEHNVADLFTSTRTHYNIKRVKWQENTLLVEVRLQQGEVPDRRQLYEDAYTLAYHSFSRTRNVSHLTYRVTVGDAHLMSMDADRPADFKWTPPKQVDNIEDAVQQRFTVRKEAQF